MISKIVCYHPGSVEAFGFLFDWLVLVFCLVVCFPSIKIHTVDGDWPVIMCGVFKQRIIFLHFKSDSLISS